MAFPWRAKFSPAEAAGAVADHNRWGGRMLGVSSLVLTGGGGVAVDFHFTEGENSCLPWQDQSHKTSLHPVGEVVGVLFSNAGDGGGANGARGGGETRQKLG